MVTRVQVGSLTPLPGVPGLGELAKEGTLHRAYFRPAGDPPRAPSTQFLERKSPLRSPVRLLPLPRPFFKDQAPDMKSPITSWGPARPAPPYGHPQDGVGEKLAAGSVGQEVGNGDGLRRRSTSAFHRAEFLQLSPATTIVLETTTADPAPGKGVREGAPGGSTLEPHSGSRPEVAAKPAVPTRKPVGTLPRPASLPQDTGPAVTPEASPKEPLAQASSVDSPGGPALDPRPRPKRRPVSAIYTDSIQPQKPAAPGGAAPAGKTPPTPPEKTWVRRPRPLSVDLTARFESREALLRKGAEGAPAPGTAQHRGPERAEPEPKVDGERWVQAEAPRDSNFPEMVPKTPEWKEKVFLRQAETSSLRTAPATVDTPKCEQALGDPLDREQDQAPPAPSPRPGKGPDAAEVKSSVADRDPAGSFRRRISLVEGESPPVPAAASEPPPASPASPSEGPGKTGVSIQDRIKGWAGESPEPKLQRRRKVFQARPLSVDLTRLFSSAAARPEVSRYEKCSEPGELSQEPRAKKDVGPVSDAATSPRSWWKSGACGEKVQLPERKDASSQVPDRCRGGNSPVAPSVATPVTPDADESFQTVRATLFEHRVERHTVATASMADCLLSGPRPTARPERGLWLGKDPGENTASKPEACRWLQSPDVEKSPQGTRCSGEPGPRHSCLPEKSPSSTNSQNCGLTLLQRPEHPPATQKVQPLVDVGERAHSQAVPVAPEETAVTLRSSGSRRWLKAGQQPLTTPAGHPPEGRSDGQGSGKRASLIWEGRGALDGSGPKAESQEPKGNCPSPRWTRATVWHQPSALANAERGQERSPDVARPRDPEAPSVRTSVISEDPHEGRRGTGHQLGDRGPSWGRPSDTPSWGRDASTDLGARPGADAVVFAQKVDGSSSSSSGLGATQEGGTPQGQAPEVQVRMRRAGPSDQRTDRWRRRTLPHDVRFEEFNYAAPEPSRKVEQRRPDLPGSVVPHKTEGGSPGSSQDQGLAPRKPASPAEPRATFFALTCQIPSAPQAKSTKPEAPGLTEPASKAAPPPSPHLTSPSVSADRAEAPRLEVSKSWTKNSAGPMPVRVHPAPGEVRLAGHCKEAREAGALWVLRGSDERPGFPNDRKQEFPRRCPSGEPAFRDPKASDLVQKGPEVVRETVPGRSKDGYRSSVLDIDALMEEYGKQRAQGPGEAPAGSSAQANRYFPEKPGQQGGLERTRRSLQEGRKAEGPRKQAGNVETNHSATPTRTSNPGATPSPKTNAFLWTVPPASPREKYPGPSTSLEGPRNNVSGPAEDEKTALAGRHHHAKSPTSPGEPSPAAWVDPGRRRTRDGEGHPVSPGGGFSPHRGRSPLDVKRAYSEKGAPAQVREGLSVLQHARERRREQSLGRSSRSPERSDARETRRGLGLQDSGQKVRPLGDQEQRPQQVSPTATSPRRSHSFCRDKRSGPLVDQLKQCFSRRTPEAKDTDTLVQEADSQYGTWTGQRQSGDSLAPESPSPDSSAASARKQPPSTRLSSPSTPTEPTSAEDSAREQRSASVDRSSAELDSTDGPEAPPTLDADATKPVDDFAFIDQTSVLDSSALKTRVQLSKRSRRRAPTSHAARRSRLRPAHTMEPWEEAADSVWMFKDSTEEKPPQKEESDEEEKPRAERTPGGHTPRTPAFPGVDPAVLKAQLHKRPEADSPGDTSSWAPQPKTPRSPFQPGMLGSRVLPSSVEKDERSDVDSPLWLKELKSKKRQSLYENQA